MAKAITLENISKYLDENGYLSDINIWNEEVAKIIAEVNNIALTEDHLIIIRTIRSFYLEYKTYPILRVFLKKLKLDNILNQENCNSIFLNKLFGETPIPMAGKIAGLPRSKKCINF